MKLKWVAPKGPADSNHIGRKKAVPANEISKNEDFFFVDVNQGLPTVGYKLAIPVRDYAIM
jgi:hypothetical protein